MTAEERMAEVSFRHDIAMTSPSQLTIYAASAPRARPSRSASRCVSLKKAARASDGGSRRGLAALYWHSVLRHWRQLLATHSDGRGRRPRDGLLAEMPRGLRWTRYAKRRLARDASSGRQPIARFRAAAYCRGRITTGWPLKIAPVDVAAHSGRRFDY